MFGDCRFLCRHWPTIVVEVFLLCILLIIGLPSVAVFLMKYHNQTCLLYVTFLRKKLNFIEMMMRCGYSMDGFVVQNVVIKIIINLTPFDMDKYSRLSPLELLLCLMSLRVEASLWFWSAFMKEVWSSHDGLRPTLNAAVGSSWPVTYNIQNARFFFLN